MRPMRRSLLPALAILGLLACDSPTEPSAESWQDVEVFSAGEERYTFTTAERWRLIITASCDAGDGFCSFTALVDDSLLAPIPFVYEMTSGVLLSSPTVVDTVEFWGAGDHTVRYQRGRLVTWNVVVQDRP
jgi:hypothetical protein